MFQELLAGLARELDSRKLPYMVIGGQAVLLYGEPRLTRDIDITLGVGKEKLDTILQVASALKLGIVPQDPGEFVDRTMVLPIQDMPSGIRVDFIFSFTPYERQAIDRARKIELNGATVNFAAPEDLIIHKIFAGRPQDQSDVRSVLLKNPELDLVYIRRWLKEFDAAFPEKGFSTLFDRIIGESGK
jgi:hypothetical protein